MEVVCKTGMAPPEEAVSALVQAVMKSEGVRGSVVLAFLQESTVAELNSRYRRTNESTDVLSFLDSDDAEWLGGGAGGGVALGDDSRLELGEVAICPEVVRRYADGQGQEYGRQMAWTIIHGVLHLLGYDHESDSGEMRRREQVLLHEFDRFAAPLTSPAGD